MINAHLGEDTEIAVLVLRELSIESLQQFVSWGLVRNSLLASTKR